MHLRPFDPYLPASLAKSPFPLFLGLSRANVTKDPPIGEPEGVGHRVADIGPTEHGQRDAQNGVEYGDDFSDGGFRRDVAITCMNVRTFTLPFCTC